MVKLRKVYIGMACAGLGMLFFINDARSMIPTIDVGNIAGTVSIVKNGGMNLKTVIKANGHLSKLMTIIGDAASSLSQFQQEYGAKIDQIAQEIEKVQARKEKAREEEKALVEAELKAEKEAHQAALDKADLLEEQALKQAGLEALPEEKLPVATIDKKYDNSVEKTEQNSVSAQGQVSPMTPEGNTLAKNPDIDVPASKTTSKRVAFGQEQLEKSAAIKNDSTLKNKAEKPISKTPDTKSVAPHQGFQKEKPELKKIDKNVIPTPRRREAFTKANLQTPNAQLKKVDIATPSAPQPVMQKLRVLDSKETQTINIPQPLKAKQTPAKIEKEPLRQHKFRVSPQKQNDEKISSARYHNHKTMAYANMVGEKTNAEYVNDVYVLPFGGRCSIDANTFINNKDARDKCIETIIRENNADNMQEAEISMRDCTQRIFKTVIALLAEATKAKYEAANYSDTLDKQDEVAAQSPDVRGDLQILAMSNKQTQLLLNRISMSLASQLLLDTAKDICAAQKIILGDSDMEKDSGIAGEK